MRALKTPWPADKWNPTPGTVGYVPPTGAGADPGADADPLDDDDLAGEDDRPVSDRPRHPANKWESR